MADSKNFVAIMAEVMITGKRTLKGEIEISGSKNAVLPEMAVCLLTEEKVVLTNVPEISDKQEIIKTLQSYQVSVNSSSDKLEIQAGIYCRKVQKLQNFESRFPAQNN